MIAETIIKWWHRVRLSGLRTEFRLLLLEKRMRSQKQPHTQGDIDREIAISDRLCEIRDEWDEIVGRVDASEELLVGNARLL